MKVKVVLRQFGFFVAFVLVYCCCGCRENGVRSTLAAVDEIIMDHPEEARGMMEGITEEAEKGLSRSDRNFCTLLRVEADWKCYYPVAGDTAIFRTVDYYRKHGPQDRLARSLVLKGAVQEERGEHDLAMETFKEAEHIYESLGDLEQLGLIHIRIGELYERSIINISAAKERYRKALYCFEKIGAKERIMSICLSLASALLPDSTYVAESYLKSGLQLAVALNARQDILSACELYTYILKWREDYSEVINIAKHIVSDFGKEDKNPVAASLYTSIITNCIESYAALGSIDSARFLLSRLPLDTQLDSLQFYSVQRDIASAEGDWKEAYECQAESDRISSAMLQASYDERLVEVEKKYETSRLQEELYRRNNRILVLVAVFAALAAAASVVFMLLGRAVKREKAEAERQTGIAVKLRDAAGRLEYALRAKSDEAAALKQEKRQEEEARRDLEGMLRQQAQSNMELLRYYGKAQKAMQDLVNIYDARISNPRHFMEDALDVAKAFIVDMNSPAEAAMVIEAAYPGFLGEVFGEFPGLSDDDRHLIILTCCGYPNGAVCTILGISETNLAVRKTRLARRMGIGTSLVKYLRQRLGSWRHVE